MTIRRLIASLANQEHLNFVMTNRIPRRLVTRAVGWFSRLEQPWIRKLSLHVWGMFSTIELDDAERREFSSMHECFIRRLKPGTRPLDLRTDILVSPCDAIVGAHGTIHRHTLLQAKGSSYSLQELLLGSIPAEYFDQGSYVTLRITAAMYHRFHAPYDCMIERVDYLSGDTWNVNPIALRRVPKLFCKNERAVIHARLRDDGQTIALVPVAAILVAGIRLNFLDVSLHLKYDGPCQMGCRADVRKGEELGWFEHGSTIIVITPAGFTLCGNVIENSVIRVGQPLLRMANRHDEQPPPTCADSLHR